MHATEQDLVNESGYRTKVLDESTMRNRLTMRRVSLTSIRDTSSSHQFILWASRLKLEFVRRPFPRPTAEHRSHILMTMKARRGNRRSAAEFSRLSQLQEQVLVSPTLH